jgi:pimeloyl-ACP methyl ester carboxylesterase
VSEPIQKSIDTSVQLPTPYRVLDLTMDDGAIIRVRRHGNPAGPRLALSHGNGLATNLYFPFWNLLRDRYDLIIFDVRNHGENPLHGAAGHNTVQFVADFERILEGVEREFGPKPIAGVFHSLSGVVALRHALEHPARWRALVLFDPPLYPRDGHPLRAAQQHDKMDLAARALRRTERYKTPDDFARQLARNRGFTRWRPETYALMARATLREDPAAGDWILACPREFEARVFDENRDPTLWTRIGEVKPPLMIIGADPNLEDAGPPALISKAVAEEFPIAYEAIPGTTHFLQVEQPEACVAAMEKFLARHGMAG